MVSLLGAGHFPDGIEFCEMASAVEVSTSVAKGLSLKMAVATPDLWLLVGSVVLNHTHMGVSQNVIPHHGDIGFQVGIAARTCGKIYQHCKIMLSRDINLSNYSGAK